MPVEYVYTKPAKTKKPNKKLEVLIFIIILAIAAYFLFFYNANQGYNETLNSLVKTFTYENKTYKIIPIPPEYKGPQGLDYIRNNSAFELTEAKILCTNLLNGEWVDTSNALGCYNMRDFSTVFCERDIIKTLVSLCNQINGNPECSRDRVVCSV